MPMRVVIALGGQAMHRHGEAAMPRLAELARGHQLILAHGPGVAPETVGRQLNGLLPQGMPLATIVTTVEPDPAGGPQPLRLTDIRPLRLLAEQRVVTVCVTGPPATHQAFVEPDHAAEALAREIGADIFVLATDVGGVYRDFGTARQHRLDRVTPHDLRGPYASGSMGPKVAAAVRFAELTRRRAAIGALSEVDDVVAGRSGTQIICCGRRK